MDLLDFADKIGIEKWELKALAENINILPEKVLNRSDFDFAMLSGNPNVTVEFILAHPEIKWNYERLSSFINIEEILANPELPWHYPNVSQNITLTIDHISLLADKLDFKHLSCTMSIWDIIKHPELPWTSDVEYNFSRLSEDQFEIDFPNIVTIEYVIKNIYRRWYWHNLNDYFSLEIILQQLELPWCFVNLSKKDLPIEFIREHQDKLYFVYLARYTTPQIIFDNLDLPWEYISLNDNLSFDDIINNPQINWDFQLLSYNKFLGNKKSPKSYELHFVD